MAKSRKQILKFSIAPKTNQSFFLFDLFFEARAEIQKYFCSFFSSNENFEICFRDLLTFRNGQKTAMTEENHIRAVQK